MRSFAIAAAIQFIAYLNLTINFRAIAHKRIGFACLTDVAATAISYFIIKQVAQSDGYAVLFGMMLGGGCAAYIGIRITEKWS